MSERQEAPLCGSAAQSLAKALSEVADPRGARGKRYPVGAVLSLSVCAMLCGARSLYAIAQWGRDHEPWLTQALGFDKGVTPCVATLHLLFKRLDREALEVALSTWFLEQGLEEGEAIALDGKCLRGIHGEEMPGVHLIAAYAHHAGHALAQSGGRDQGE